MGSILQGRGFANANLQDYRLLGLVGQGQFAQVYCAVHRRTGRLVAIKKTRHASENASQEPFILHDLKHPNVMGCQAISQVDGGYHFVLDYCEAGTLRSHLDTAGPLSLSETKSLIGDILQGLSYIHQQSIIHGDLKPENILLTHAADTTHTPNASSVVNAAVLTAKIGDLGSARFVELPARSRREIGSPTYAAPERFEGHSSYLSDLYSVGVMLYELLLGDRPFSGSPEALWKAHQMQSIPLPDTLSEPAKQLLIKALQKQPDKRFQSATAMHLALKELSTVHTTAKKALHTAAKTTVKTAAKTTDAKDASLGLPDDEATEATRSIGSTVSTAMPPMPLIVTDISQATAQPLTSIPTPSITEPIESLVTIPQGCCIITARSLHILTLKRQLIPIAQFEQACWTVVAPNGQWFVTLPKHAQRKSRGRLYALSCQDHSATIFPKKSITLTSPLLTALRSDIVQVLAIDNRHLLRVRAVQYTKNSKKRSKTYLECFTRRGQFIAQLSLNLSIVHMTPTAMPYQFMALAQSTTKSLSYELVLVTLKPFQIRHLRLPIAPEQVSAFPWGCAASSGQELLLLDRESEPVSLLTQIPLPQPMRHRKENARVANPVTTHGGSSAITAMGHSQLLIATSQNEPAHLKTNSPATNESLAARLSSLVLIDLAQLELGLIF